MFKSVSFRAFLSLTACASIMSGCALAPGFTETEKDISQSLSSSKFQPASREMRDNIETQELFAQAAFWSREYELNPGDLESSIKLAAAVRKLGNAQRAVEIAQTSRALYPRDPYLTAEFAAALIASEQAYEAMKPLDDALRTTPGYARLWSLKGAALDQQENYDLARKHYARALKITPNDPNIMANLGLSYALSGDPQTAEGWLRRAVSVPGASQSVRQNLALVLQLQGKEAEAAKYSAQPQLRGSSSVEHAPQPRQQTAQRQAPRQQNLRQPNVRQQNLRQQTVRQATPSAYAQQHASNVRSYQTPSRQSGIPASERGRSYKQGYTQPATRHYSAGQTPQTTLREGSTFTGQSSVHKSTAPLTASDAARLAAQSSTRRKVTRPLGDGSQNYNAEQTSVLEQIAKTIGPQASGPALQRRSLQPNTNPNYSGTPYQAAAGQSPQNYGYQPTPVPQAGYPTRRQAARARR